MSDRSESLGTNLLPAETAHSATVGAPFWTDRIAVPRRSALVSYGNSTWEAVREGLDAMKGAGPPLLVTARVILGVLTVLTVKKAPL